jgi:lipoyl-dependent peroxiredoxin subunit D
MAALDALRDALPEAARDLRLNLSSILESSSLSEAQRWGVAAASALVSGNARLREMIVADAKAAVGADVLDDAVAAAALMGMNNVYYRFRHVVGKASYATKPARLRMNRLGAPKTNKADLELFCLAVSAINNCEMCVRSHEEAVLKAGLNEEQVHDAVRLAATVHGVAAALDAAATPGVMG